MNEWIKEHFYDAQHPKEAIIGWRNDDPLLVADLFNFPPNSKVYYWLPINNSYPFVDTEIVVEKPLDPETPVGLAWTKDRFSFYNIRANELQEAFMTNTTIDLIDREPEGVDEEIKLLTCVEDKYAQLD